MTKYTSNPIMIPKKIDDIAAVASFLGFLSCEMVAVNKYYKPLSIVMPFFYANCMGYFANRVRSVYDSLDSKSKASNSVLIQGAVATAIYVLCKNDNINVKFCKYLLGEFIYQFSTRCLLERRQYLDSGNKPCDTIANTAHMAKYSLMHTIAASATELAVVVGYIAMSKCSNFALIQTNVLPVDKGVIVVDVGTDMLIGICSTLAYREVVRLVLQKYECKQEPSNAK